MKPILLLAFSSLIFTLQAQNKFTDVDTWLKNNIDELGGRAVIMVLKEGKIIYSKSENKLTQKQKMLAKFMAKRQNEDANEAVADFTTTTKSRIASCSKWLTAALAMTFIDEGKLKLDDSVGKYLPILSKYNKGYIKIWHCLAHLTGIKSEGLKESLQSMQRLKNMDESMEQIAQLPIEGEAGKIFRYGNTGLQIIAAIIEKISSKSFEENFQEKIAQPCQMVNTTFGSKPVVLAAGGAFSTPVDYMHFLQMILQNGSYNGKQIISKKSIEAMQKNYTYQAINASSPEEANNLPYGFGEWIMDNTTQLRSNYISSPGLFGTFPWVENSKHYAAILFTFNIKTKGRYQLHENLKALVDKALQP